MMAFLARQDYDTRTQIKNVKKGLRKIKIIEAIVFNGLISICLIIGNFIYFGQDKIRSDNCSKYSYIYNGPIQPGRLIIRYKNMFTGGCDGPSHIFIYLGTSRRGHLVSESRFLLTLIFCVSEQLLRRPAVAVVALRIVPQFPDRPCQV